MSSAVQKVLLVDDDPDAGFLMQKALLELPFRVQLAYLEDSAALLAEVMLQQPDLIFMDINMPKKNGIECLGELQRAQLGHIPVVVYSSSEQSGLVASAYEAGATLYFRKPSSFRGMVQSLETILSLDWQDPAAITRRYCNEGVFRPFALA